MRYIEEKTCYKIIKVDKIVPAHIASFDEDYSTLQEKAKNELAQKAIDDFIDEKLKTTYIVIDPLFKTCNFKRKGLLEAAERSEIK